MAEISIKEISRVIGHASLSIKLKDKAAESVKIEVTHPKRNFEKLAIGRRFTEVPYIMSRICGACSFSHHMASAVAIERALGNERASATRELLIIAEKLHNHAFHLYWHAIPDYTAQSGMLGMLPKNQKTADRGILLMQNARKIKSVLAGRYIHPLGYGIGRSKRIGRAEIADMKQAIQDSIEPAKQTAEYIASLETEFFARKAEYMCVSGSDYPNIAGNLISTAGMDIPQLGCLDAEQDGSIILDRPMVVGALARMNNRHSALSPLAKKAVKASRVIFPNYNPLMNNFAQAVEIIHFLETAMKTIERLQDDEQEEQKEKDGIGTAAIESSKGTIIHQYEIREGIVRSARIRTSAEHNIRNFQEDALKFAPRFLKSRREEIVLEIGKLLRAYDLCFTCASH